MGHHMLLTTSLLALTLLMQGAPVGGGDGMGDTDSVKYLTTFGAFIDPLYGIPSGTSSSPSTLSLDTLPALVNIVKLLHTKARYYNTTDHMTNFFANITNQKITNCKEQYHATEESLLTLPKGNQFDFNETLIFGLSDLFCQRVNKLLDIFQTIHQLTSLSERQLDGMTPLAPSFGSIPEECQIIKLHAFLAFHNKRFDRDYVERNVRISDLENNLRQFINQSFESIASIESSLKLPNKFQNILQRVLLADILAFLSHVGGTLILLVPLHATGLMWAGCQMGGCYIYSDSAFSRNKYAKCPEEHTTAHYLLRVRGGPSDD